MELKNSPYLRVENTDGHACEFKIQMGMPASCKNRWPCLPVRKTDENACELKKQKALPASSKNRWKYI